MDAKTLGSELRRQYAKRNRAQVMIDFLETSGIGSQPDGSKGYANKPAYKKRVVNPSDSYDWREQQAHAFQSPARRRQPQFEEVEEDDFSPQRFVGADHPDPTEANDRELI